jgi:hypothetical protein
MTTVNAKRLMSSMSGDTEVAGSLEISAPAGSYAFAFSHDASKPGASAAYGVRLRDAKTLDEQRRGRDDHHQPPRQIHSSRREI